MYTHIYKYIQGSRKLRIHAGAVAANAEFEFSEKMKALQYDKFNAFFAKLYSVFSDRQFIAFEAFVRIIESESVNIFGASVADGDTYLGCRMSSTRFPSRRSLDLETKALAM